MTRSFLLFCDLFDQAAGQPLSTQEIEEYPQTQHHHVLRRSIHDDHIAQWYCNRGVYVRSSVDPKEFYCFCSGSYYGDRCQYQRKRITLRLKLCSMSTIDPSLVMVKLVLLLVRHGKVDRIISHEQSVYTPQHFCLPLHTIVLYYPINESLLPPANHSVLIYAFAATTLKFLTVWTFPVQFEFLPVNRIAKQLVIPASDSVQKASFKSLECHSCSNVSLCLGYDTDLRQEMCVCPMDRMGSRCLIPFNPCNNMSCNGHGKCLPVEARRVPDARFICMCYNEWFGTRCNQLRAHINIVFSPEITPPQSRFTFVHVVDTPKYYEPTHFTYFYRLSPTTSRVTFFFDDHYLYNFIFLQLFDHRSQYDYYLVLRRKAASPVINNITSTVQPSYRCRKIEELFDSTVVRQVPLRRVKNYQKPCLYRDPRKPLRCFYDEKLMCFCDETNHTICFNFDSKSYNCQENRCSHRGLCVQDHPFCPKASLCLCEPCSYGTICQFTSAGYALSLEAILGSHIQPTMRDVRQQSQVIRISFALIMVLFFSGTCFNVLSIGTFHQKSTHEVGSGIYLLVSSCFGLLTIVALLLKIIFLLQIEQNDLTCSSLGFLLKWWSTSCEWIDACVSMERHWP